MSLEFVQKAIKAGKYTHPEGSTEIKLDKRRITKGIERGAMLATVPPFDTSEGTSSRRKHQPTTTTAATIEMFHGSTLDGLARVASSTSSSASATPAVLIFSSDTNPGGSKKGTNVGTQEEFMCRNSTLRPALDRLTYPIPTAGVAYVPDVCAMLPDQAVFFGAIGAALRCAVAGDVPSHKEMEFLRMKIRSVLDAALHGGHRAIVLGAWGCGAFGNPPEIIAGVFAELLTSPPYAFGFERVVFAISNEKLLHMFDSVFSAAGAAS